MFSMRSLIKAALYPDRYIWMAVLLIKETKKAILVAFDGKRAWFPKRWIAKIKKNLNSNHIRIKISEYNWDRKF